jgi:hypothetical protein
LLVAKEVKRRGSLLRTRRAGVSGPEEVEQAEHQELIEPILTNDEAQREAES